MYGFLKGEVEHRLKSFIYLNVSGVGYKIFVSNPYSYDEGATVKLFTHLNVREDDLTLFGFDTLDSHDLFMNLLGVKGIGAKTSMTIVSSSDASSIQKAIEIGNADFLCKFPGIGKKTAQQIILDLKGKLNNYTNKTTSELEETLISFGYKPKEFKSIVSKIDENMPLNKQIKEALSMIVNK